MEEIITKIKYLNEWDKTFSLFKNRYEIYKQIDCITDSVNWWTYFDILVVQLRALCFENERYEHNYTVQNLLLKAGNQELVLKLKQYFDKPIVEQDGESLYSIKKDDVYEDLTIRKAVKYVADKIICHNDFIEDDAMNIICLNTLALNNGEGLKKIIEHILNILL